MRVIILVAIMQTVNLWWSIATPMPAPVQIFNGFALGMVCLAGVLTWNINH